MKEAVKQALAETLEPILTQIRTEAHAFIVATDTRLTSAETTLDDLSARVTALEVKSHTHASGPPFAGEVQ